MTDIRIAIRQNDPVQAQLPVILVISNPCQYARRYVLARDFIQRMETEESDVILYIVELSHDSRFHVTTPQNPRHLQVATSTAPLWHKENLINMGVRHLLPCDWKAMAWIDGDIEFDSPTWALDALRLLNGTCDVIQLFSHIVDMDNREDAMSISSSFGFQYCKKKQYGIQKTVMNHWHPGYAWAITRSLHDKMGGLFDTNILGGGDNIMALSFLGQKIQINVNITQALKDLALRFEQRVDKPRIGYVPGIIRHYFHGQKLHRRYQQRWKILVNHHYNPLLHMTRREDGLLVPTPECPQGLLDDILLYFQQRKEDA